MSDLFDVLTGEVRVLANKGELVTTAVGSCIAVAAFDRPMHLGGLAHIMLPGKAPANTPDLLRYAENAFEELLRKMESMGSRKNDVQLCIAGGANVLEKPDDTICELNIASVTQTARRHGLMILARSLRGIQRRRIRFDVADGSVYCTLSDEPERLLWRWRTK